MTRFSIPEHPATGLCEALAHAQDPQCFDLIPVKSVGPYARCFTWATKTFTVDVLSGTSANLAFLPALPLPMFPLDRRPRRRWVLLLRLPG